MKVDKLTQLLEDLKIRKSFEVLDYSKGLEDDEYYVSAYIDVPDSPVDSRFTEVTDQDKYIIFKSTYNKMVKAFGEPHSKKLYSANNMPLFQWDFIINTYKQRYFNIQNSINKGRYRIDNNDKEVKFYCIFRYGDNRDVIQQFIDEQILGKRNIVLPKTTKPKVDID